jgi:AcrR family transcriptional regulator
MIPFKSDKDSKLNYVPSGTDIQMMKLCQELCSNRCRIMTALSATRGRPRAFNRDQALRAAQRFIWQHGYEAMSLSQLEIVMGIGKTSLYAAFGSKLELLQEAAELYLKEAGGKLTGVLDSDTSTCDAMAHFLEICAEDFTDPSRPKGCFLVAAAPVCSEDNEQAIIFLRDRRAAVSNLIRSRLERGISEGDITSTTPVAAITEYIMTVVHGMSIQARDGSTELALKQTVAMALLPLQMAVSKPNG